MRYECLSYYSPFALPSCLLRSEFSDSEYAPKAPENFLLAPFKLGHNKLMHFDALIHKSHKSCFFPLS